MKNYINLVARLESHSANRENHGGISAEAADVIKQLIRERDALLEIIHGDCEHCVKQEECEHYKSFEFPPSEECEWEWDEDY